MRSVTLGQQRMYVDVIDTAPSNCHELQYTVTAYNSLGSNAASVIAGYPIRKSIITLNVLSCLFFL